MKCTINVMGLNHPKTIPPPQSMEKLSSTRQVPGANKVGECWYKSLACPVACTLQDITLAKISNWSCVQL